MIIVYLVVEMNAKIVKATTTYLEVWVQSRGFTDIKLHRSLAVTAYKKCLSQIVGDPLRKPFASQNWRVLLLDNLNRDFHDVPDAELTSDLLLEKEVAASRRWS